MAITAACQPTTTSAKHSPEMSSIEAYLIHLTKRLIDLLNRRAYDDPFFQRHVSQDVFVDYNGSRSFGLGQFIQNYKQVADISPEFTADVWNESAMVDEDAGTATVILSQHLMRSEYALSEGKRAANILKSWRLIDGVWYLRSSHMMFGTPEFLV